MTSALRLLTTEWRHIMESNELSLADVAEEDKYVIEEQGLWGTREDESEEMPA